MDNKLRPNRNNLGNRNLRSAKNVGFVALLILMGLIIITATNQTQSMQTVPLTKAVQQSNAGDYSTIVINGNELDITKKGAKTATIKSYIEPNATLKGEGFNFSKVTVVAKSETSTADTWLSIAGYVVPTLLIAGFLYFMLRSAQGQGNQALSFGKSRARLYGNEKDRATFSDIAGSNEAKQDLEEVVEFLKFPKKFATYGRTYSKGCTADWAARYR